MKSVVMVMAGVLQSWGTTSIGHARATNTFPTKSGVIGMIANALGRDSTDDISDLASLGYSVRVDSPGTQERDYHTVSIIVQPTKGDRTERVTERYYLADAVFLGAVSSDNEELIDSIAAALRIPARPLYLGRKSCSPTRPVFLDVSDGDHREVISRYPWQAEKSEQLGYAGSEITLDVFRDPVDLIEGEASDVIADQPITFNKEGRRYGSRGVFRDSVTVPVQFVSVAKPSGLGALGYALAKEVRQ